MNNPRKIIADVARRFIGVHEESENWSPEIARFWSATSIPDGALQKYPWCAAFVCAVLKIADEESKEIGLSKPATMPNVSGFVPWAKGVGAEVITPNDLSGTISPRVGDIVDYLPHLSHIGIVADFDAATNRVITIEGNTNAAGGREGVEVAVKYRPLEFCGHFIRVPVRAIK